ncbi:MAG: hypothetical protein KDC53_06990 [Saprospiraceae bacterium]|nr:hypothetical protein [Saprospiraceae bacterium]
MVTLNETWIIGLIIVCSTLSVLMLIVVFLLKFINTYQSNHALRIKHLLHQLLVDYLLGDSLERKQIIEKIQRLNKSRFNKKILIDELLILTNNFSGIYAARVFQLYKDLQLNELSLNKLRNPIWHQKLRGMYELSTLEYSEAFDEISDLIYHPHGEVRRNARVSLIKLKKKDALMTLKDLEGSMSQWTYVSIIAILKQNPIKLTGDEIRRLKSAQNPYVKTLAYDLEQFAYAQ